MGAEPDHDDLWPFAVRESQRLGATRARALGAAACRQHRSATPVAAVAGVLDRASGPAGVRLWAVFDGVPGEWRFGEFLGICLDFPGS